MQIAGDWLSLLAMSSGSRMRVIVDIERGATTVNGQITVDGADPSDFFGWLELIDGLERAAGHRSAGDPVPGEHPGALNAVPQRTTRGDAQEL
jgi:hypothetical protein